MDIYFNFLINLYFVLSLVALKHIKFGLFEMIA